MEVCWIRWVVVVGRECVGGAEEHFWIVDCLSGKVKKGGTFGAVRIEYFRVMVRFWKGERNEDVFFWK